MACSEVAPGLYQLSLGIVNVFLLEDDAGLVLVDSGTPGSAAKILSEVRALHRRPEAVHRILVTHLHADHTGSLAALKRATGARVAMHPTDAALIRQGKAARPMQPGPGIARALLGRLLRFFSKRITSEVEAVEIEEELRPGEVLAIGGGLEVIAVSGHTAGQVAFLWHRHGGVLLAADAASNVFGHLGPALVYEELDAGQKSLRHLAARDFEVACFGHGRPILFGAAARFRQQWGGASDK